MYIHNTKESLALNLEIGKTNWHSTEIANNGDSALSLVVRPNSILVGHIHAFCLENGRWQAAISSSETVLQFYWHRHSCVLWYMCNLFLYFPLGLFSLRSTVLLILKSTCEMFSSIHRGWEGARHTIHSLQKQYKDIPLSFELFQRIQYIEVNNT